MSSSNKQNRARNLLVKLLVFLTTAESCWYTINGDINHEYSLARRLGFYLQEEYYAFLVSAGLAMYRYDSSTNEKDELIIKYAEWNYMIDAIKLDHHDVADSIDLTEKRFDRVNAHKGIKQRNNRRCDHKLIRIGKYLHEGWSHENIAHQLKDRNGNHKTPRLTGLSPLKRSLVADAREMFTNVIASDFDFYENLSNTNLEPTHDDDDDDSEADNDQPLTKKPRLARYSAGGSALGLVGSMDAGEAEIAELVSGLSTQQYNMLFAKMVKRNQTESGDGDMITYKNTGNNKKMQYVRVPTNTTEQSFLQHSGWLDKVLQVNGGGEDSAAKTTSAKRIAKKLIKQVRNEEGDEVLEELGLLPQEQLKMGAVKIAAMFKAAGIRSRHRRRALLRHLRHFFGNNVFDSEKKVQMLCDGHTKVHSDVVTFARVEGGLKERVYYSQKNIADEFAAQLARELNHRDIVDPKRVQGIDVMAGGDHGKGAFVFGAKVVVYVTKEEDHKEIDEDASFLFEISVAEIVCSKDCGDIIAMTIKDELTKGLETIAKKDMTISVKTDDSSGKKTIFCSYDPDHSMACAMTSFQVTAGIYVVGDLACHGMVLGKESMSGKWCHLCKMAASMMAELNLTAEHWTMEDLVKFAQSYAAQVEEWKQTDVKKRTKNEPPPQLGVKEEPWWNFIPLDHYIVPLLHCNIGIGDLILSKFRSIVSEKIEYLSPEETSTRIAKENMDGTIEALQAQRNAFHESAEGKELQRLKGIVYRAKKALSLIDDANKTLTPDSKRKASSLLDEVQRFVEEDIKTEDGLLGDLDDVVVPAIAPTPEAEPPVAAADLPASIAAAEPPAPAPEGDTTNTADEPPAPITPAQLPAAAAPEGDAATSAPSVATRIQELKNKQADCKKKIAPLEQKLKLITNNIAKAKKYKSSLNDKINEFKKTRKNSGDGIESEMFLTLKSYGIEVQAYHGGSLHGKDVQKLMNNASDIFSSFADILKKNKKEGCVLDDAMIDALCKSYAELCVLWDGAFSYASTIDPTKNDIDMYQRFVTAAVHLHAYLGLNVTPKVHLMWKHVADQMGLSGGLGNKREDWVEKLHQTTGSVREQYHNSRGNVEVRGISMARLMQQETHQEVVAHCNVVNADSCTGPRKNYTSVEELRKQMRQTIRLSALSCWEGLNPDKKHKVVDDLICGEAMT